MLISLSISAQVVSKDSINNLKQQKDALEVSKKLNENKLELAKLENELEAKTREKEKTAEQAQKSADDNNKAAEKLANNAQDKSLSRKASKAASGARKDAKRARKASDDLDKLTKNIDLQLNVQNLTDETYYDKAFSTHFANQAPGRTALLSTNFHF